MYKKQGKTAAGFDGTGYGSDKYRSDADKCAGSKEKDTKGYD